MDALSTVPDFGASFGDGTVQGFSPAGDGPFAVLPAGIALASTGGQPAFALNMVRRADRADPTGNYAVMDVQLADDVPLDAALSLARTLRPDATVVPATIDRGFARLVSVGGDNALPEDMTKPVSFGASATGGPHWEHRLDLTSGELIKAALLSRAAFFTVRLEYTVVGVSPRVSAQADFAPAVLVDALLAGGTGRSIAIPDLMKRLMDGPPQLKVTGSVPPDRIAQIMADRLCAAFATFIPAPGTFEPATFAFAAALSSDPVSWDLNKPVAVSRAYVFQIDLLDALKAVPDPATLVHEIPIPALDLGFREIVVGANLPPTRIGVPAIGARITMPAALPGRPNAINKTVTLNPPNDQARLALQVGPDEPLDYTMTGFALIAAGSSVHQLSGPPRPFGGEWLHLEASDLPVGFAHLTASDRLLKQATIAGALTYSLDDKPATQAIVLKPGTADVAVAIPVAAKDASIVVTATAADGAKAQIGPLAPGVIRLDLASFPGYGPHRIAVTCTFAGTEQPLTIELQTEDESRQGSVTLVPSAPWAEWGYVATSPFHAGYRYRKQGGSWSAVIPPNQPLTVKPDGSHAG